MKITIIATSFPKLSETFVLDQITAQIDRGHDVRILAFGWSHEGRTHESVERYGLKARTTYVERAGEGGYGEGGYAVSPAMIETLIDTDLIHAHFAAEPALFALDMSELCGIPFIFTAHAYDLFIDPDGERLARLAEGAAKVLTISDYNRDYMVNLMGGRYRDKIEIVRCGIHPEFSAGDGDSDGGTGGGTDSDSADGGGADGGKGAPDAPVVILTVGRLVEKKGIAFGIDAFAELCRGRDDLSYRIIGEGPLRGDLEQRIRKHGLEGRVRLLGGLDRRSVAEEMAGAHISLQPSVTAENGDREGLPVTILEAMAMGLPVVSTEMTGIPEAVRSGETGFLVPEGDSAALADKLELLVSDRSARERMGKAGRARVAEQFDHRKQMDKLDTIMAGLLEPGDRLISAALDRVDGAVKKRIHAFLGRWDRQRGEKLLAQATQIGDQQKEIRSLEGRVRDLQEALDRIRSFLPVKVLITARNLLRGLLIRDGRSKGK